MTKNKINRTIIFLRRISVCLLIHFNLFLSFNFNFGIGYQKQVDLPIFIQIFLISAEYNKNNKFDAQHQVNWKVSFKTNDKDRTRANRDSALFNSELKKSMRHSCWWLQQSWELNLIYFYCVKFLSSRWDTALLIFVAVHHASMNIETRLTFLNKWPSNIYASKCFVCYNRTHWFVHLFTSKVTQQKQNYTIARRNRYCIYRCYNCSHICWFHIVFVVFRCLQVIVR